MTCSVAFTSAEQALEDCNNMHENIKYMRTGENNFLELNIYKKMDKMDFTSSQQFSC
jgi:hypothetical protein